jgi:hypothetical protein
MAIHDTPYLRSPNLLVWSIPTVAHQNDIETMDDVV